MQSKYTVQSGSAILEGVSTMTQLKGTTTSGRYLFDSYFIFLYLHAFFIRCIVCIWQLLLGDNICAQTLHLL